MEAKLREAQADFQEAAAQVAALAAERAAEAVQELPWLNQGFSRHALIGVQLSGESSKDGVEESLDVSPFGRRSLPACAPAMSS